MGQPISHVEIEERRPQTWNEPRRKRLNFVKPHRHYPDDWALVPPPTRRQHHPSQQELWDRRQWEAQRRFLDGEFERVRLQEARLRLEQERRMPPRVVPLPSWPELDGHDPRIQPLRPVPPQHGGGHHGKGSHHGGHDYHGGGHRIERGRGSHHGGHDDHHDDRIIQIVSGSSECGSSNSGVSDSDHSGGTPQMIECRPVSLPKHFKIRRSKSRGCKDKPKRRRDSSSSEDSSSEDKFTAGFRAGRKVAVKKIMPRGRSHGRFFEDSDDSFDDLVRRPVRRR